jgi:hypothetical protein
LREKVMATSGSGSKVIDESTGQSQLKTQSSQTSISARQVHKQDDGALFSDECAALLADVRNDNSQTTWYDDDEDRMRGLLFSLLFRRDEY